MNTQTADSATRIQRAPRRVELDWLRTLVVLGIIPYHALVIFGASSAVYIKSTQFNPALGVIGGFVLTWGIPLIFLMSGAAARLALEHRTAGAYVRERFARLFVPLLVVALLLSPVQIYFVLLSDPSLASASPVPIPNPEQLHNFGTFYGTYVSLLVATVRDYSSGIGGFTLSHLWFVPRLLVVSLLTLALIQVTRRFGLHVPVWIAGLLERPAVFLFGGGLVVALVWALLEPGWLGRLTAHWPYTDIWSEFFLDFALFVCGYLVYGHRRLLDGVRDLRLVCLALGLAIWIGIGGVTLLGKAPPSGYAPASVLFSAARSMSAWLLCFALLGLAMRYFTTTTRLQRYLSYASFPVYLLHLPVLTISAYYLLKLSLPWYLHLLLILTVTLLVSFGFFEFVIRHIPFIRFLFGVPKQTPQDEAPVGPPSTPTSPRASSRTLYPRQPVQPVTQQPAEA